MLQSLRPGPAEIEVLCSYLRRVAPLDAEDLRALVDIAWLQNLARGQYLLRAGDVATQTGVVLRGLLREFFVMSDGTERTKAFVRESQATGSLADLLSDKPSRAFIVAEEPVHLLALDFAELRQLAERSPGWSRWSMRMLEVTFINKAEREYELLGMDADERYARFEERFPGLEARVAAKHVASYLGITPVHLSRLRRRRLAQKRANRPQSGAT